MSRATPFIPLKKILTNKKVGCSQCLAYSIIKGHTLRLKKLLSSPFIYYEDQVILPVIDIDQIPLMLPEEDIPDDDMKEDIYRDGGDVDYDEPESESESETDSEDDTEDSDVIEDFEIPRIFSDSSSDSSFDISDEEPPNKRTMLDTTLLPLSSCLELGTNTNLGGCGHLTSLRMQIEPTQNCFGAMSIRFLALVFSTPCFNPIDPLSDAGFDWSQPMRFHFPVCSSSDNVGPLRRTLLGVREIHPIVWILRTPMNRWRRDRLLSDIIAHSSQAARNTVSEMVSNPLLQFDGTMSARKTISTFSSALSLLVHEFWFRDDGKDNLLESLLDNGCSVIVQKMQIRSIERGKNNREISRIHVLSIINNLLACDTWLFFYDFKHLISHGLTDFHGMGAGNDPVSLDVRRYSGWSHPSRQYSILDEWVTFCDTPERSQYVLRAARVLFSLGYGRPEVRAMVETDTDPHLRAERHIIRELRAEGLQLCVIV